MNPITCILRGSERTNDMSKHETADTIKRQIGTAALMYSAARGFLYTATMLTFLINVDGKRGKHFIEVVYISADDTYTMRLKVMARGKVTTIRQLDGLYAEALSECTEAASRGEWHS